MWKRLLSVAALFLSVELASAASTTTPNLGLVKPEAAPGSWGEDINRNLDLLDAAFVNAAVSDPVRTLSGRGCSDTGSTDAYACTMGIPDTAYLLRALYFITPATINTGAASVNFNGLGFRNIKRYIGGVKSDPVSGDICPGQPVILQYDGTDMVMQNPPCNPASGGGGTPGGSTTQIQFNSAGAFGGDSGATYDPDTDTANFVNINVGACSPGCVAYDPSGLTAERPRVLLDAPGDEVVSSGAKVTGNCPEWDASGRLVDSGVTCGTGGVSTKVVQIEVFPPGTATATGDGKAYFRVPSSLNGMSLVTINANVLTAGTTGTINIDVARCVAAATGNVCSSTVADMLSTNLTIDSGENSSSTAAAAVVINTTNDDVSTGQILRIDIDAVHTTPAQGLIVNMEFQ